MVLIIVMKQPTQIAVGLLIMLTYLISMYLYPSMPELMPTHWNQKGEVDRYMHKFWALFLIPFISTVCVLMFYFVPKIDPLKKNIAKFNYMYKIILLDLDIKSPR